MPTRDDVIRMAREAWADAGDGWVATEWFDGKAENFERFAAAAYAAALVAAERERWVHKLEQAEYLVGAFERGADASEYGRDIADFRA